MSGSHSVQALVGFEKLTQCEGVGGFERLTRGKGGGGI